MVTGCVIRKCSSVWSPISYTSYHCFPLQNQVMMEKWMKSIPPGYITIPKMSSRICSRHFVDDCFKYSDSGKRSLKKDAVPTLFGTEARKEDIVLPNADIDRNLSSDEEVCRYVKKSKYLRQRPVLEKEKPMEKPRPMANQINHCKIIIQKPRKLNISQQEIQLKKQIIVLKKRLLRRENKIKSMMKIMDTISTIKNDDPND